MLPEIEKATVRWTLSTIHMETRAQKKRKNTTYMFMDKNEVTTIVSKETNKHVPQWTPKLRCADLQKFLAAINKFS
jgi:hypothetical protein